MKPRMLFIPNKLAQYWVERKHFLHFTIGNTLKYFITDGKKEHHIKIKLEFSINKLR